MEARRARRRSGHRDRYHRGHVWHQGGDAERRRRADDAEGDDAEARKPTARRGAWWRSREAGADPDEEPGRYRFAHGRPSVRCQETGRLAARASVRVPIWEMSGRAARPERTVVAFLSRERDTDGEPVPVWDRDPKPGALATLRKRIRRAVSIRTGGRGPAEIDWLVEQAEFPETCRAAMYELYPEGDRELYATEAYLRRPLAPLLTGSQIDRIERAFLHYARADASLPSFLLILADRPSRAIDDAAIAAIESAAATLPMAPQWLRDAAGIEFERLGDVDGRLRALLPAGPYCPMQRFRTAAGGARSWEFRARRRARPDCPGGSPPAPEQEGQRTSAEAGARIGHAAACAAVPGRAAGRLGVPRSLGRERRLPGAVALGRRATTRRRAPSSGRGRPRRSASRVREAATRWPRSAHAARGEGKIVLLAPGAIPSDRGPSRADRHAAFRAGSLEDGHSRSWSKEDASFGVMDAIAAAGLQTVVVSQKPVGLAVSPDGASFVLAAGGDLLPSRRRRARAPSSVPEPISGLAEGSGAFWSGRGRVGGRSPRQAGSRRAPVRAQAGCRNRRETRVDGRRTRREFWSRSLPRSCCWEATIWPPRPAGAAGRRDRLEWSVRCFGLRWVRGEKDDRRLRPSAEPPKLAPTSRRADVPEVSAATAGRRRTRPGARLLVSRLR